MKSIYCLVFCVTLGLWSLTVFSGGLYCPPPDDPTHPGGNIKIVDNPDGTWIYTATSQGLVYQSDVCTKESCSKDDKKTKFAGSSIGDGTGKSGELELNCFYADNGGSLSAILSIKKVIFDPADPTKWECASGQCDCTTEKASSQHFEPSDCVYTMRLM